MLLSWGHKSRRHNMQNIDIRTIDGLKAAGHCFAAGALARTLGQPRSYGCHFGMRSDLNRDRESFEMG